MPVPVRITHPSRRGEVERELARPQRLAALRATRLLGTPPEEVFDRWTTWLRGALGAEISMMSLIDHERLFAKSFAADFVPEGPAEGIPIDGTMCQYVVASRDELVIEDARRDPDLADHAGVTEMGTVAYAGTPIRHRGEVLGTLCVIEVRPRAWEGHELALLRRVAEAISTEIDLRAAAGRLARANSVLAHQARAHELIARGAPLAEVLALLGDGLERELPGATAAFHLGDSHADGPWELAIIGEGARTAGLLRVEGVQDAPDVEQRRLLADAAALAAVAVEREHTLEQLTRRATLDSLTGLPNRSLFLDRLTQALTRARRSKATTVVAFVDLDRFKWVNDSLGHAAGDELLRAVAQRLHGAVRASDTVGRLGGDEFAILAEDVTVRSEVVGLVERVLGTLKGELVLECGARIDPRASVGVAVVPAGGAEPDEVLLRADTAMYRAKRAGGGRIDFYDDSLRDEASVRLTMETALRRALDAGQLHVALQPIVALDGEAPTAVEALLRWDHPELGPVPPLTFIPIAEEVGLINEIGEWVLREACAAAMRLSATHGTELHLAVNLSPRQLDDPELVGRVRSALDDSGLPAERLALEITESALLAATDEVRGVLRTLRALLSSLRQHTVDAIKVDRSFVSGLADDGGDRAIVTALVGMAHALGCAVTGEGVEDECTLEALRDLGCDHVQGYLIARPAHERDIGPALHGLLTT
jgi:diguanylate cyclase (GGDEF)-like protein